MGDYRREIEYFHRLWEETRITEDRAKQCRNVGKDSSKTDKDNRKPRPEGKGMTCPECGGVGGIQYMDEWGAFTDYIPCETCNGTGEIPNESTVYGNDCPGGKCEM